MHKIYVSNSGNDNNDGSKSSPFLTLNKALECARNVCENVEVIIENGRYFFKDSLELNENDTNVAFRAEEKGKVFFDGGFVIDNSFASKTTDEKILSRIIDKNARNHIYEIDLSEYPVDYGTYGTRGFRRAVRPSNNELFINSEVLTVAQYPNKGEKLIPITKVIDSGSNPNNLEFDLRGGIFKYDDERCSLWEKAKDFYVSGYFQWSFADDTLLVEKINLKEKTIKTKEPTLFGFGTTQFTEFYAINLLEEIDIPGEYYIDSVNKKIYFYPPCNLTDALLQVSNMTVPFITIIGSKNISFDGIVFENSRGTGIYMEKSENCNVKNCIFRNLGMIAVQIGQGATALPDGLHDGHTRQADGINPPKGESKIIGSWHEMLYQFAGWDNEGGKNNGVDGCEIYDTGTGGIILGGGDRKTLKAANNYVNNTKIYRVNRLDKTYKAGINICGVGNTVSHCEIFDLPGFAIYVHGNDHLVEYNKIYDVIKEVGDAGAIYIGRDLSEVGNIFRYNFIYNITGNEKSDMGVTAIYFDDYSSFNAVYGNYFYNIRQSDNSSPFGVVFWNCGGQTSVSQNIFIDCPVAIRPTLNGSYGASVKIKKDNLQIKRLFSKSDDIQGVDVLSDVYRERYPYLYELAMGTYKDTSMIWSNIVVNNDYSMFRDFNNLDLTISEDNIRVKQTLTAFVYDPIRNIDSQLEGFEVIDFSKIGLYQSED